MRSFSLRRAGPAGALLLAFAGCGDDPGGAAGEPVRWDSAGIEIVASTGRDVPLAWGFEPLFALGGDEEGPGSFFRVDPSGVGADGAGRVHVLDYQGARVAVFGPDGAVLGTVGGRGEGPGELSGPNALAVSFDGEIAVFDFAKRALVRFGPGGEILRQRPLDRVPVQDGARRIAAAASGVLLSHVEPGTTQGNLETRLSLLGEEGEGVALASFEQPSPRMIRFDRCGGGLALPPVFGPTIAWDARDTRVASNSGAGYRIDVHQDGRPLRSLRRELPPLEATRSLAEAELGEGITIRFGPAAEPCLITPAELVDGRGFEPIVPWVRGLSLAPDGGLWVTRRSVEGGALVDRVDVFGPDGAYRGTLPPGTPLPILLLPNGRVAYTERDALDVERLVVARIVEATDG